MKEEQNLQQNGRLKKDEVQSLPMMNPKLEGVRFHEVKLTNYNDNFDVLLQQKQKNSNKDILLICDVSPPLKKIEQLSAYYSSILIFDHHETLLKNCDIWKQLQLDNVKLFYSCSHSAAWIFNCFLKKHILDLQLLVDKNFYNDISQKIRFIDLNDTTVIKEHKICQFIEYSIEQRFHAISDNPAFLSQAIFKKKYTLM